MPTRPTTSRWGLERTIQLGLLVLVALMPFHAFFSVWLGSLSHHEAIIQAWKEGLLLLLAVATVVLVWREPSRLKCLRRPWVYAAGMFALIAVLVTIAAQPPLTAVAFGLKTDLEFLVAAVIAVIVTTPAFMRRLVITILATSAVVIAFGLLQIFVLPANFLTHFGYGPATVLPYEHLEQGISTLRFAATLGGPNQLGTYLILPLCLSVAEAVGKRRWWWLLLTAGGLLVLWHTYSRGAWIGAVAAIVLTWTVLARPRPRRSLSWGLGVVAVVLVLAAGVFALHNRIDPYLHHANLTGGGPSSDSQHALSLQTGLHDLASSPFGHGLGTAGPATFHAGTTNILENYYLQTGYETGIIGMLAFIVLIYALLADLRRSAAPAASLAVAASVIGISIVALVLPSWVDSSTALITWTAAGAAAGLSKNRHV